MGRRHLAADLGRHKACPYRVFEGDGGGDVWTRDWAGTRPAPTGLLRGEGGTELCGRTRGDIFLGCTPEKVWLRASLFSLIITIYLFFPVADQE